MWWFTPGSAVLFGVFTLALVFGLVATQRPAGAAARARTVLILHGHPCALLPMEVEQGDGTLTARCGDRDIQIYSLLPCESGSACNLGFWPACYEVD